MCRVRCPDEPDSCKRSLPLFGKASVFPRRNHLLHDLITHVFLRSFQYGIVVMCFIDAFVYAYHRHRRSIENPWNFDCMKGGIFFMTAITFPSIQTWVLTLFMVKPQLDGWPGFP